MNGWIMVYTLVCGINGTTLSMMGYGPNKIQWWVIVGCVILAYISGLEIGKIK